MVNQEALGLLVTAILTCFNPVHKCERRSCIKVLGEGVIILYMLY